MRTSCILVLLGALLSITGCPSGEVGPAGHLARQNPSAEACLTCQTVPAPMCGQ